MRLDRWCHHQWPWIPFASIQRGIRKKHIRLEGHRAQGERRLASGDTVWIREQWLDSFSLPQEKPKLSDSWEKRLRRWTLYEDDHCIVFNKPAGLASQGGSQQWTSMDDLLQQWRPHQGFRLVHRLDKETSGVFLVAKTLHFAQSTALAFQERRVKKCYLSLVHGCPPSQGTIKASLLRKDTHTVASNHRDAKKASTAYCRLASGETREGSLVALFPTTGRTHQLRVHMQAIGHPIIGDALYGGEAQGISQLLLHCYAMKWDYEGTSYSIKVLPPPTFREIMRRYGLLP